MKIVYFYQFFTTPKGSYGTRVYEFTKEWVKMGHEVTVVTSIFSKSDIKANRFIENQIIDGIKLKVINLKMDNKQSFSRRVFSFALYGLLSTFYALFLRYDLILCSSGPISVGFPGLIAKLVRNKKFVFEVRDLWPEAPIELGVIKNTVLKKIFFYFEKICYAKADLIIALSSGMKSNILNRFSDLNVVTVTNSANIKLFSKKLDKNFISKLPFKKYAIYAGNIGFVNNSDLLLRSAKVLNDMNRNDIGIVLIGDGQQKKDLVNKSIEIPNIVFLDLMPKTELVNYMKNAFCSIIPLHNTPMLSTSSPNKLFESMAASLPVIQTTKGWMSEMLCNTKSGYTVSPSNENELVEKLIFLADNQDDSIIIGKRGYSYAKENFDKKKLSFKMLNSILKLKNVKNE